MTDAAFFRKYQKQLLWLFNTRIGRWFFHIHNEQYSSLPRNAKVVAVLPNAIAWRGSSRRVKFINHPKGLVRYNKSIGLAMNRRERRRHEAWLRKYGYRMPLLPTKRVEFRANNRFAYRLNTLLWWLPFLQFYKNFDLGWQWRLNFGLTIQEFFPASGTGGASVDGVAKRDGVDETISQIAGGAGTIASVIDSEENPSLLEASTTTNQFALAGKLLMTVDTSSLGWNIILSAEWNIWFNFKQNGLSGEASANSAMVIVSSAPASDNDLVAADYGTLGAVDFGRSPSQQNITTGQYTPITLNQDGIDNISTAGISRFGGMYGWIFDQTITGLTWSSGATQRITALMADQTGTSSDPKLVIDVSEESAVTTDPTAEIQKTQATGRGELTVTGLEDADERGFVFGTSSQVDPGNVAPGSSGYDTFVNETGSFRSEKFTNDLTGLLPGTKYFVRAYGHKASGYSYGNEVSFTTIRALISAKNFGKVQVAQGYDAAAVSIALVTSEGTKLPDPAVDGEFNLVWWNFSDFKDPTDDPNREIVRVTARSGDTLTVTRAQEGTSASTKNAADKTYAMMLAVTKRTMEEIEEGIFPKLTVVTSSPTPTPTGGNKENVLYVKALAEGATLGEPTGSPGEGNRLIVRIKDDGTSRTIGYNAIYRAVGVTLPTATTAGKTIYLLCYFNSVDVKWDVVTVAEEA